MTKKRVAALAGLLGLVGAGLSAVPIVLEIEEALGLAWLFRVRGPIDPPDEVAIVSLSGESAEALGVSYHVDDWPRRLHAEVVDRLAEAGAAVIVFDIMFIAPRPDDLEGDARLASAIARAGNVVLAERVVEKRRANAIGEERRLPIEPLRRAALATAPFMLPLVPVRVSQSWTFGRAADTPSLPSVALHAYALSVHDRLLDMLAAARPELAERLMGLRADVARENGLDEVMRRLRSIFRNDPGLAGELREQLDGAEAPLLGALIALYAGDDSRYLNYYGPARTIPTVPYHEVLVMDTRALREAFSGRAVFIGFSESRASEQQDEFVAVYADRSGQRLAGVEIGATLFANLLRLEAIRPTPLPVHLAVVAAWGIVAAAIGLLLRGFAAIAVGAAAGVAFAAAAQYVFEAHGLWTPLAIPLGLQLPLALLVGLSLSHGVLRRQRERVRSALGYYVPASVVDRLAKESLEPHANREVVFGTCLVTDAEQYTTLSESLHPSELVELMDAYYEALVDVVHRHGGVVSDIGGDSMIAVWPAAGSVASTRIAASRAALDILAAVEAFNAERVHRELPTRIGIDSGQLLLGNVGASVRGEYRAVGDIVNTAARLQGLNRLLGTRVLVSEPVAEDAREFVRRPLGQFLLVGKRVPVTVAELQARKDHAEPALLELNAAFADALERFRAGDFVAAEAAFKRIVERFPGDRASRFFAEVCRALAENRPRDWDGIVRVKVK